jgi:two-component sensor histidine kinase
MALPAERRTLKSSDDAAALAQWAVHAAQSLDPALPAQAVRDVGAVVHALVENAQRHGTPPITVEVAVASVLVVEVSDHGPGAPVMRPDRTGALATVVDVLAIQWDVLEFEGGKTVFAAVAIPELSSALPAARTPRSHP